MIDIPDNPKHALLLGLLEGLKIGINREAQTLQKVSDGVREVLKKEKPFICPDCGAKFKKYFDGHDCACGKTYICNKCFPKHKKHRRAQ